VPRFKPGVLRAVVGEALALGVTALTWTTLVMYHRSLAIGAPGPQIAFALELVAAIATLAVPAFGARALARTLRARALASEHRLLDARTVREEATHDLLYVLGLGLMALMVAFGAYLLSANHALVRGVLLEWSLVWSSRTALLRGFWWNVRLFVVAEILVLVWALIVAVVRQLPGRQFLPIRLLAIAYADVFRGVPTIIVIYLVGFGFPLAHIEPFYSHMAPDTQLFWLGIVALVLVYGGYVAEVYRAGLESVHWSQTAAARSLGLSQWQTLRYVVIPQAVRRILPPLLNDFVALQKDTALVGFLGLAEILNVSSILKNNHFNLSPVTGAAIFFLVVTIPCTRLVDFLIKRDKAKTQAQ
jgi:polar amino acid transport system permease protein